MEVEVATIYINNNGFSKRLFFTGNLNQDAIHHFQDFIDNRSGTPEQKISIALRYARLNGFELVA